MGRNPLRRRTDRRESGFVVVLMLVLVVAMLIGGMLGARTADHERQVGAAQEAAGSRTAAVLLENAPSSSATVPGTGVSEVPVHARWHGPDGTVRGVVHVAPGTPAGSRVPIWLDQRGQLADNPGNPTRSYSRGVLVGLGVPATVGLLELGVLQLARRQWGRSRAAAWDAEWERVEPIWKSRWRNV